MKVKKFRSICSVMGCRNTDTFLISRNGVNINTPNICKECLKMAYIELFPEETSSKMNEKDKTVNESVNNTIKESFNEPEGKDTTLGETPKKRTRKKE